MNEEILRRYARLIAVTGGGIRPGQSVVIRAALRKRHRGKCPAHMGHSGA